MPGRCLHAAQTTQPPPRGGQAPNSAAPLAEFGSGWLQTWALNILPPVYLNPWKHVGPQLNSIVLYCPWQDDSTACAEMYTHTHIYIMFVDILVWGEAWPLCSPQVAQGWSGFRKRCCAPTQNLTHHRQGQAHTSPLLRSAPALWIRRQTGNESRCALVSELITLRRHCQFCFCAHWSRHPSGSGCNFRAAARAIQEDVFLDKSKVLKYSSTQLRCFLFLLF